MERRDKSLILLALITFLFGALLIGPSVVHLFACPDQSAVPETYQETYRKFLNKVEGDCFDMYRAILSLGDKPRDRYKTFLEDERVRMQVRDLMAQISFGNCSQDYDCKSELSLDEEKLGRLDRMLEVIQELIRDQESEEILYAPLDDNRSEANQRCHA